MNRDKIKNFFSNKENIIIFIIVLIITIYGAWVRLSNLHTLSLWFDDGQAYLGTLGVLKYGYPMMPSGFVLYHTILTFYIRVFPALILGLNEVALRLPSAIFGVLIIPLIFLFVKEVSNKYIATISAIITSLNFWQIEFSREARYYSEFQFFYLLSVYFFYLGFIKEKKIFKVLYLIFFLLTTLTIHLGFSLIFLFLPLLIYKGYKKFFKKDTIIYFLITSILIIAQLIHRFLYWKVGKTFYLSTIESANIIIRFISKFIGKPKLFFFLIFKYMFPGMYYVVLFGIIIFILYISTKPLRSNFEKWVSITNKNKFDLKLPFNLFFIYFIFFSNVLSLGIGNMYNQQRYVHYAFPYLIIIYSYIIYEVGRLITIPLKQKIPKKIYNLPTILIPFIIFIFTISSINPLISYNIPNRKNGDTVNPLYCPSGTTNIHFDFRNPGKYINKNMSSDDIIISTELINTYPYANKFDNWIWSGNLVAWQPYYKKNINYYDNFFGSIIIRDINQLMNFFNNNNKKNIWLFASYSLDRPQHVSTEIKNFLTSHSEHEVFLGEDNITKVYYFPKDESRFYTITDTIKPISEEIINFPETDKKLFIDFLEPSTANYLKHGWSEVESCGTWSNSKESSLFINFNTKNDYKIKMRVKPFLHPETNQKITIYINNNLIGEAILDEPDFKTISFTVPKEFIKLDNYNSFSFQFKYNIRPSEVGLDSPDPRRLSVLFEFIEIEKI